MSDSGEKLTPEQLTRFEEIEAKYLGYALSTAPADRPRAEAAFSRAYRKVGRKPVPVIWVDSPMSAALAIAGLRQFYGSLANSYPWSFGFNIFRFLCTDVIRVFEVELRRRISVDFNIKLPWTLRQKSMRVSDEIETAIFLEANRSFINLGDSYITKHLSMVFDNLPYSGFWRLLVRVVVGSPLKRLQRESSQVGLRFIWWKGQFDLSPTAVSEFYRELQTEQLVDYAASSQTDREVGMSCGFWFPFKGYIIACERPEEIHLDERNRIHSETGAAIQFRDGWSIYANHGRHVPGWVVTNPEKLTVEAIDAENNLEDRRFMIQRFGTERYVREGGAERIASDPVHGDLYLKTRRRDTDIVMLHVKNNTAEPDGTIREFWIRIHPECRPFRARDKWVGEPQEMTPLNARASTWGMTGEVFKHLAEAS